MLYVSASAGVRNARELKSRPAGTSKSSKYVSSVSNGYGYGTGRVESDVNVLFPDFQDRG